MKHFSACIFGGFIFIALAGALIAQETKSGAAPSTSTPAALSSEEVLSGKTIYGKHCAVCHYAASDAKKVGPGLKGMSKRGTFLADGKPMNDAALRAWIEVGGKNMPAFKDSLSSDQIRDLVTYLKTL